MSASPPHGSGILMIPFCTHPPWLARQRIDPRRPIHLRRIGHDMTCQTFRPSGRRKSFSMRKLCCLIQHPLTKHDLVLFHVSSLSIHEQKSLERLSSFTASRICFMLRMPIPSA